MASGRQALARRLAACSAFLVALTRAADACQHACQANAKQASKEGRKASKLASTEDVRMMMQSEAQLHSQLVGDCVLSLITGITSICTWAHAPEQWRDLQRTPVGVRGQHTHALMAGCCILPLQSCTECSINRCSSETCWPCEAWFTAELVAKLTWELPN